eukprot:2807259-Heterocapsa_arctica.AAC.1
MKAFTARLARKTKRMSKIAKRKYSHKAIVCEGMSEETIMNMLGRGLRLFPAIDVNGGVTKPKSYNVYGCRLFLSDGNRRATGVRADAATTAL